MSEKSETTVTGRVQELPMSKIGRNPYQPRQEFDETKLKELADSIREKGLIQPIVVRLLDEKQKTYELIAGERRFRACQILKRETIPGIVREVDEEEARELMLIENVQREDLTLMEEARCLSQLAVQYDGNRSEVARKTGKSMIYVNDRVGLLTLPTEVQSLVEKGEINMAQAKVIRELKGEKDQIRGARYAVRLQLSANELKGRMQRETGKSKPPKDGDGGRKVTFDSLSRQLVQFYETLAAYDFGPVLDTTKRAMLRRQIEIVQKQIAQALEKLKVQDEAVPATRTPEAEDRQAASE